MGRKKIVKELKRQTISISLDKNILDELIEIKVKSKSELINSLLKEYLNLESHE